MLVMYFILEATVCRLPCPPALYSLGFGAQVHELQQHLEADGGTKAVGSADTSPNLSLCFFMFQQAYSLGSLFARGSTERKTSKDVETVCI